ncbi:MAG TPA: trypsin-like peptidase domain-containing protein [Tepidisphaeraceae bacterium]|jgi:S1-C subfamily serine protease|nr:trypsin-like peptidase domain-containing protein [Tepidisphaeraceae bacterium]
MGRFAHTARGGSAALLALSGLLFSCSSAGSASRTAVVAPAEHASHVEISDNFDIPDLEQHFLDVAKRLSPSVVAISATDAKLEADDALRSDRINPEKLAAMLEPVDRTVGTGFIVDSDGYIVTNDHVVATNENIWVTTDDHRVYPAIVVGSDPRADLAVLKIPASKLPAVHFCDAAPRRGQWSVALGNPYGLAGGGEMSLSVGVVSATGRSLPKLSSKEDRLYSDLIQTTTQINPGNSGGPLFDVHGDVIGINAAVILPQKLTNGIGFAIPVTARVRAIIQDLKEGREVAYGWLGVRVTSPTPLECKEAGLGGDGGAKIESIDPNSPASCSKLRVGDIVASFDGTAIDDSDQFIRLVGESPIDHRVKAVAYRNGRSMNVELTTARRQPPVAAVTRDSQRMRWRGMLLGPIPRHWDFDGNPRPESGLMIIAIDPSSPFVQQGAAQGSIITTVAGKSVKSVTQLQRIINDTAPGACGIGLVRPPAQIVSVQE